MLPPFLSLQHALASFWLDDFHEVLVREVEFLANLLDVLSGGFAARVPARHGDEAAKISMKNVGSLWMNGISARLIVPKNHHATMALSTGWIVRVSSL